MTSVKIFSGTNSFPLSEKIADAYGKPLGKLIVQRFSDGEMSPFFDESVRGCDVFLVQSTNPPAENIMELLLMSDAARRASAKYVTLVVPYFGYARQDRKDKPRVSIAAKVMANLFSSVGADRLMTCDLHAGQIQGFFDFPVDHLDGAAIFKPYVEGLNLEKLVFAAPDVGGVGRARSYAQMFKSDMVVCDKHRKRANEVASMQIIGDVEGADVIIVDDIIDTGGTISQASEIIMSKGARSVRAICTHPILSGKAVERIEASALDEVIVSDTIPCHKVSPKIKILSVSHLFATAIRRVHDYESISSLFVSAYNK